jgi:hypothetical protein
MFSNLTDSWNNRDNEEYKNNTTGSSVPPPTTIATPPAETIDYQLIEKIVSNQRNNTNDGITIQWKDFMYLIIASIIILLLVLLVMKK